MKKLFSFFLLFVFLPRLILSNEPEVAGRIRLDSLNFIAHYTKQWQPDSTDIQWVREEPMILLLGNIHSKFYSFNRHLIEDSILPNYPVRDWNYISASRRYPATINFYQVFKNQDLNTIEFFGRVGLDLFKYNMPLQVLNWQILPDTMQVSGYAAQKATTSFAGRDWVAWFAPEIPISDGPYKFNGLPGLIVQLYDTRNHYRFSLTSFVKVGKGRYVEKCKSLQSNAFNTTRRRMIDKQLKFIQNPFSFMPNITHTGGAAQREELLQRLRRRNNPLELRY